MKFKLVESIKELDEEVLNEATTPQYRTIIFNLVREICTCIELKKFLIAESETDYKNVEIHHIDGVYEKYRTKSGTEYIRAKNNEVKNLAVGTKKAHKLVSSGKSLEEVASEEPLFILNNCIPKSVLNEIEDVITEE